MSAAMGGPPAAMNRIADATSEDVGPLSNFRSPYSSPEHEMLRAQVRRFVETEIKPKALAWEDQGYVPRDVLRRMGSLGFFGIRYPARYGGSEMDTLASVVLAEELGRSTFTGVSYTVLIHLSFCASLPELKMPRIISGEVITAVAVTEPDAGSDVKGHSHFRAEGAIGAIGDSEAAARTVGDLDVVLPRQPVL